MEEALSSSSGPLLASLSAFWLRLSEKASSLGRRTDVNWGAPEDPGRTGLRESCLRGWISRHLVVQLRPPLRAHHLPLAAAPPRPLLRSSGSSPAHLLL